MSGTTKEQKLPSEQDSRKEAAAVGTEAWLTGLLHALTGLVLTIVTHVEPVPAREAWARSGLQIGGLEPE